MLRDVVVRDLHGQGDMLRAVGATGADLGREALNAARRREASLQHGLLKNTQREQINRKKNNHKNESTSSVHNKICGRQ